MKKKLIRITTVPISLHKLIRGQMKFMSDYYEVIAVSSSDKILDTVSKNENVRVEVIEMTREITLAKDIKALWGMYKLLRREKPLIVHTHTPKAGIVGMMAAWLARVPIRLHTVAGLPLMEATGGKRKLLNLVEKFTYAFANRVYPNSYGLYDFIVSEKLCSDKKLKVIGSGSSNGIDSSYFDPAKYTDIDKSSLRKSLNIGENDFVFVFVGRLVKDKGINELVSAFSKLANDRCKLLLVGSFENELDPLLPETVTEIDNNSKIISVGYQDDVRPYLSISDCLAFPSYREGFPNVVMQAGAMGLPSIVTDINGCNEIIINGENGVIIPAKDENALFDAMKHFIEHFEDIERMASKARKVIVDRYEQKAVWEAMLAEYKRLEEKIS
jgi:glycosyltransferase involved in cell wall biosynthesis